MKKLTSYEKVMKELTKMKNKYDKDEATKERREVAKNERAVAKLAKLRDGFSLYSDDDKFDSLDVFAVHGVGGMLGTLLAGILAADFFGGLGLEKSAVEQTMVQALGILTVALLSFVGTVIIVKIIQATVGLRVSEEEEIGEGLDFGSHGESSYNL